MKLGDRVSPWLAAATDGIGDCEAIRDGFLRQPSNAISSLAFLLAAVWIAWRATKVPPERAELLVLAVIVAANGVGSFGIHGPSGTPFRWFHDLSALAIPLFVAMHDAGLVRGTALQTRRVPAEARSRDPCAARCVGSRPRGAHAGWARLPDRAEHLAVVPPCEPAPGACGLAPLGRGGLRRLRLGGVRAAGRAGPAERYGLTNTSRRHTA